MVQNTRVKRALSRKQVVVTPVSNNGIKPHTGDPHQFNTSIDPTKLHYRELKSPKITSGKFSCDGLSRQCFSKEGISLLYCNSA